MRKIIKFIFVMAVFCCLGENFSHAAQKNKSLKIRPPFNVSSEKTFDMRVPLDYKVYALPQDGKYSSSRLLIIPPGRQFFKMELEIFSNNELSPISPYSQRLKYASGEKEIKKYLSAFFENIKADARSKVVKIRSFSGEECKGFYFKSSMKSKDNHFKSKYVLHGVLLVKGYIGVFTIKGNYGKSKTDRKLINLLKTAKIAEAKLKKCENVQEENVQTLLAFLGQEYQKIQTVKAAAGIVEVSAGQRIGDVKRSFVVMDAGTQKIRMDNKKEQLSYIIYPEDFYEYYNLLVRQADGNKQVAVLDDLFISDLFVLFTPWRDRQKFLKEHSVKVASGEKVKKGLKVLTAEVYPFVFKFYSKLDIVFDISKNYIVQLVYYGKTTNIKAVVKFEYAKNANFAFPKKVKLTIYNKNMILVDKQIAFNDIVINKPISKNIFSLER